MKRTSVLTEVGPEELSLSFIISTSFIFLQNLIHTHFSALVSLFTTILISIVKEDMVAVWVEFGFFFWDISPMKSVKV